jgi:hypothetical protein
MTRPGRTRRILATVRLPGGESRQRLVLRRDDARPDVGERAAQRAVCDRFAALIAVVCCGDLPSRRFRRDTNNGAELQESVIIESTVSKLAGARARWRLMTQTATSTSRPLDGELKPARLA